MKNSIGLSILLLLCIASTSIAQKPRQYKRIHQEAFRKILNGQTDAALAELTEFLETYPDDEESHYMAAVAYARQGKTEDALASVSTALEKGLPPGRIVGGTLTGLESLEDTELYQQLLKGFQNKLVHGPMLGNIQGEMAEIWLRTAREANVQAVASVQGDPGTEVRSPMIRTDAQHDYTATIHLTGLTPNTTYQYYVLVDGERDTSHTPTLRTTPAQGQPIQYRIAFGGGAGYVPEHERAWITIQATQPDAIFLLGDNVYSDDPTSPAMQHYCYYRRQSRPEFRSLLASTPVYSIWDDHDFGTNDCSGGPAIDEPIWKRPVYNVFRDNWVNPYFGGGDGQPGCFYDFYLGDIHFIMIDGRFYRDLKPEDGGMPTMLGPVQRAWLKNRIRHSKGRILALCSPVPWVFEAKGDSRDTWNGFKDERKEIFDVLNTTKKRGVVLISADRHRSDLWKIERPNDYPLYEFNSSRLTNQHVHKEMPKAEFSYNKKQSFGLIDFDTTLDNPTITYRIMSIDGEEVFSNTIELNDLQ